MPGSVSKWILDLSEGDSAAGDAICKKYWPRVRSKARHLIRDESFGCDEDDLAQSVFRKALHHFGSNSQPQPANRVAFWRYLEICLFHKLVDRRRRAGAIKRQVESQQQVSLSRVSDPRPSAAWEIEFADDVDYLLRLLDTKSRLILTMVIQGHENEEIARHLGVSTRTVQRKLVLIRDVWHRVDSTRIRSASDDSTLPDQPSNN
ncbi:MAG: RNA polymerase sigma factor [Pirellulaceae bacterium]